MTTPQTDSVKDFTLESGTGETLSLGDFKGRWVVLYFYPKDATSGCTQEAIDFTALQSSFTEHNAVILGISPDSAASHSRFSSKNNLTVTLLSDPQRTVLESCGVWQKKKLYGKEYMGVVRTTLLIDPTGTTRKRWDKVKVEGHADEVLQTLIEMQ